MINKKKGPGRPQKKFIPTPKEKKAGPGRPKKQVKIYDSVATSNPSFKGFVTTNILHAPKKDNIILLMFVLSLLLFLFSLYVAVLRDQKRIEGQQTIATMDTELPVVNIQTGNIPYQEETTAQPSPQVEIATPQQ
jgi:Tfp pilus assembly protein PilN